MSGALDRLAGVWRLATVTGREFLRGWDRFWFAPADPVVLSLMRVLVGGMLFYTHLVWGIHLRAFFAADGWNSPEAIRSIQEGMFSPSFWWYVPENLMWPVHLACLGVLFLFWIGCCTRVTSVLAFLITISYSYRAQMANYGLDQINGLLSLYLCIGAGGSLLSVDRWWQVRRARRAAQAAGQPFTIPPITPSVSTRLAVRLIQIHFCVIYAFAGLSKLQGDAWWNGEAVWMAFSNLEYQAVDMTWTAWYPWISDLATHSTIVWEVFFPVLIWIRPLRPLVLFMGFLMHLGIGGLMGMWTFGLIMIFGHLAFWSPQLMRRLLGRVPARDLLLGSAFPSAAGPSERHQPPAGDHYEPTVIRRPALLWVDSVNERRASCLEYFLQAGLPGVGSASGLEAATVRDVTKPAAIVLMADRIPEDDVESFGREHLQRSGSEPLFVIVTPEQSQRLTPNFRSASTRIFTDERGLEELRREIQGALLAGTTPTQSSAIV
ncbi:MAG: hypothetical protein RLZZ436_3469 [Planctomycetota bacterium]|jgi:hypothetical protein